MTVEGQEVSLGGQIQIGGSDPGPEPASGALTPTSRLCADEGVTRMSLTSPALCLGGCSVILTSDSRRRKEILGLEVRVGGTGGGDTRE